MAVGQAYCDAGLAEEAKLLAGISGALPFTQIRLGSGNTTPAAADTNLSSMVLMKTATVTRTGSDLEFTISVEKGELSATICEMGLFNENDVMYYREVFDAITLDANTGAIFKIPVNIRSRSA